MAEQRPDPMSTGLPAEPGDPREESAPAPRIEDAWQAVEDAIANSQAATILITSPRKVRTLG